MAYYTVVKKNNVDIYGRSVSCKDAGAISRYLEYDATKVFKNVTKAPAIFYDAKNDIKEDMDEVKKAIDLKTKLVKDTGVMPEDFEESMIYLYEDYNEYEAAYNSINFLIDAIECSVCDDNYNDVPITIAVSVS